MITLTWDFWTWDWDQWATFAIVFAAPGQLAFALAYFLFSPWWVEQIGRALMLKASALALILSMVFVAYFFRVPIPRPVAALTYGTILVAVYYQLVAFARIRFSPEARSVKAGLVHMAARRFGNGDESSLRRAMNRLEDAASENKRATGDIAAGVKRMEAADAVVADDLSAAQARADEVTGEPGAAADEASRSPDA